MLLYLNKHPIDLCQELVDQILGNLQSHHASLKSCSLVCRSWFFASRAHLFRRILITPRNIEGLVEIISEHPHPGIVQHVRQIELQGRVESPQNRPFNVLHSFSSALTHLYFYQTIFGTPGELIDVICGFPELRSLALDKVTYPKPTSPDLYFGSHVMPPHLERIRLRRMVFSFPLRWLILQSGMAKISHLDVGPIKEHDISYVGAYMVAIGSTLQHLAFSFGCYRESIFIPICPDLAQLTNLQSVTIGGFVDSKAPHQSTAQFWGPKVFKSIGSRDIKRVVLGLVLSFAAELDRYNIDWGDLDEVFASEVYRNLDSIEFKVQGKVNMDGIANLLSSKLPKVFARGLLRFQKLSQN